MKRVNPYHTDGIGKFYYQVRYVFIVDLSSSIWIKGAPKTLVRSQWFLNLLSNQVWAAINAVQDWFVRRFKDGRLQTGLAGLVIPIFGPIPGHMHRAGCSLAWLVIPTLPSKAAVICSRDLEQTALKLKSANVGLFTITENLFTAGCVSFSRTILFNLFR